MELHTDISQETKVERVRTRLQAEALNAEKRAKQRLVLTLGPALGLAIISTTAFFGLAVIFPTLKAYNRVGGIISSFAIFLALIAVTPREHTSVMVICGVMAVLVALVALSEASDAAIFMSQQNVDGTCVEADTRAVPCWYAYVFVVGVSGLSGVAWAASAIALGMALHRSSDAPRTLLLAVWSTYGWVSVFVGGIHTLAFALQMQLGVTDREFVIADSLKLVDASTSIVLGLLALQHDLRRRVQLRLEESSSALTKAAGIASLIGQRPAEDVVSLATGQFLIVVYGSIPPSALDSNRPDPSLAALTEPCLIGQCDAFISHSWHDPATTKRVALDSWSNTFKTKHGREPRVWLDKFCVVRTPIPQQPRNARILTPCLMLACSRSVRRRRAQDQTNIGNSLAALPVFLAGSDTLLICYGASYTTRLWCVVELFVFVAMGGKEEDVQLLPVRAASGVGEGGGRRRSTGEAAQLPGFDTFDARKAQCFLEADRERLLTFVEAGFESLDAFNARVCSMLAAAAEKHPVNRALFATHHRVLHEPDVGERMASGAVKEMV